MKKIIPLLFSIFLISGCSLNDFIPQQSTVEKTQEPIENNQTQKTKSDVLSVAVSGQINWQPHTEQSLQNRQALELIYEPLYTFDASLNPVPVLATGIECSGNSVTVNLKQNVYFHDNSQLTAADVAYSINLVANGYSEYKNSCIISATTKTTSSVTVLLKHPVICPEALFTFPIVKNKSEQSMAVPNGTGPFAFVSDAYDTLTFKVRNNYHDQKPTYSTLKIINAKNDEQIKNLFDVGETDILSVSNLQLSSFTPRSNAKINTYATNEMVVLGFNNNKIPLAVRRAVFYTLDRQKITDTCFSHTATFTNLPINPSYAKVNQAFNSGLYNLENAENEMRLGGYQRKNGIFYDESGNKLSLKIIVENLKDYQPLFDNLSAALNNFGIECKLQSTDYYYQKLSTYDYDLCLGSYSSSVDLNDILGDGNCFAYSNPNFQAAVSTPNGDINNALSIFLQDIPIVPICFKNAAISVSSKITGEIHPSCLTLFFGYKSWILS